MHPGPLPAHEGNLNPGILQLHALIGRGDHTCRSGWLDGAGNETDLDQVWDWVN